MPKKNHQFSGSIIEGNMFLKFCLAALVVYSAVAGLVPAGSETKLEQNPEFFQGDMRFDDSQLDKNKNVLVHQAYRWPNKVVPYEISPVFSADERNAIFAALNDIQAHTCIRFTPRTSSTTNFVYVQGENSGCWANVGFGTGLRELNLQPNGCVHHGIIIHEFLHALGLYHQHSATNRDNYVRINWENIPEDLAYAFDKYDTNLITDFGVGYDYESVMHYDAYAFSKNGQKTIQVLDARYEIGNRNVLSGRDIQKLKIMYNC